MKSLVILENQGEIDVLKKRVLEGEKIYVVIDGKTVFLEVDETTKVITKRIAGKREVSNMMSHFPLTEIETVSETKDKEEELCKEDTKSETTGNSTDGEPNSTETRLNEIERDIETIKAVLSKPILPTL